MRRGREGILWIWRYRRRRRPRDLFHTPEEEENVFSRLYNYLPSFAGKREGEKSRELKFFLLQTTRHPTKRSREELGPPTIERPRQIFSFFLPRSCPVTLRHSFFPPPFFIHVTEGEGRGGM